MSPNSYNVDVDITAVDMMNFDKKKYANRITWNIFFALLNLNICTCQNNTRIQRGKNTSPQNNLRSPSISNPQTRTAGLLLQLPLPLQYYAFYNLTARLLHAASHENVLGVE
jgi:hypothetical protein